MDTSNRRQSKRTCRIEARKKQTRAKKASEMSISPP